VSSSMVDTRVDTRAIRWLLLGITLRVFGARLKAPHVILLQLGVCQRVDRGSAPFQPHAILVARDIRIQRRVVGDYDHTILKD